MSELLANTLPIVAQEEGIDWEEDCYEQGQLCSSEKERIKTSTNKLTQKPEKLPIRMESMRHDIEFRQSNRSADFIQGIEEEEFGRPLYQPRTYVTYFIFCHRNCRRYRSSH